MKTNKPVVLPKWAEKMKTRYESKEASQFLLYGNVMDLVFFDDKYLWLRDFLTQALSGGKEMVLFYNISEGISFPIASMQDDFARFLEVTLKLGGFPGFTDILNYQKRPDLIKDPRVALPLIERLLETRNRIFVIIDHVDKIVPSSDTAFMSLDDRRSLATLQRWAGLPSLMSRDNAIILVTKNLADVHRSLRSDNPLIELIEIPYPDYEERLAFIKYRCTQSACKLEAPEESLAHTTAGLNRVAIDGFFRQSQKTQQPLGFSIVKGRKEEIFKEEYGGLVELIETNIGLENIAGLQKVKDDLKMVIHLLRSGRRSECPMGVGFIGPPGTGKTMFGKAIAKGAGLPFLKIGDIRDKFVGESEKNADRVLTLLRSLAPVVVFVDEIDQAYGQRGERGDSGVSQRIWAKFSEVQGDNNYRGRILWIWATNRPDLVDEATKRPGRLGDLKIPFFFSAEDPEELIKIAAKNNGIKMRAGDLKPVAEKLKGYSPAELESVVLHARWFARRSGRDTVTQTDLANAAEDFIPSRNDKMIEYMELLAILEASSRRMLPENYSRDYDRNVLLGRVSRLRTELSMEGQI